jgi:Tol biopolymer transport system component
MRGSGPISASAVECRRLLRPAHGGRIVFPTPLAGHTLMTDSPPAGSSTAAGRPADDRLESWKQIAAYLRRDVTTVQRWERREGMPVHRHVHDKLGSVFAYKTDLDAWARKRAGLVADPARVDAVSDSPAAPATTPTARLRRPAAWLAAAVALPALVAVLAVWRLQAPEAAPERLLIDARFTPLTDFDGIEQAAAISRDGRFVAFLSDHDGQMDVWVTPVGAGQFYNLTHGSVQELVNPSVRTLGFSPDGTLVTFWARRAGSTGRPDIGIWAVPVLGGHPRPYLEGAAELDWTGDGARLVYHTPGPGDPMYVRGADPRSEGRRLFSAPAGLHSHFPVWAPDQAFVYFVRGALPDRLDIWRIGPSGGPPERLTNHASFVSHPVFIGPDTMLYLATDQDGSGPWLHSLDTRRGVHRRVSFGRDRYTSLSASADGRRVVATAADPKGSLWRLPLAGMRAEVSAAQRIPLRTGNGSSPRFGAGCLVYVSSRGGSDAIWKLQDEVSSEVWSAPGARIVGSPAMSRDGRRIAFSTSQSGAPRLVVVNADGTGARVVTTSLQLEGAPAWTPDDRAITVAAVVEGTPRLVNVPLDGRPPVPLVPQYSVDPAWSSDGETVAFSGPDVGTRIEIGFARRNGGPSDLPPLATTRGGRRLLFAGERRSLVVLRGPIDHKNLWLVDLETGAEQPITDLPPEFEVRDFDISPDGRELVVERVHAQADIVLIELPRR